MSRLKRNITTLVIYLLLVISISQISSSIVPSQFYLFFYVMMTIAVFQTMVIPVFQRWSLFPTISIWWVAYLVFWFFISRNASAINSELLFIGLILTSIAVALAREVASSIQELEHTLDKLVFSNFSGRAALLEDSLEEVKTELTRSRRYHRPLSLVIIEPDQNAIKEDMEQTMKEIQFLIAKRYATAHLAEIINKEARRTDIIIKQDKPDRFIILCPETQGSNTNTLVRRIIEAAQEKTGAMVGFGIASFPEEALTFEELVNKAGAKIVRPGAFAIKENSVPVKVKQDV